MRILLVTGNYPPLPCGIGDTTHRLAIELSQWGHDVLVLTSLPRTAPADIGSHKSVEVLRTISNWALSGHQKILDTVQSHRTDIIHIQYQPNSFQNQPMITLLPWLLKRRLGTKVKIAVTLHELAGPDTLWLPGRARVGWLLPLTSFSDAVIVTNERDHDYLRRVPWFKGRLHRIPLASPLDAMPILQADCLATRKQLRMTAGDLLLVRFGFVHNIRFSLIPELLQATRQLLHHGHPVKLLFVGGENETSRTGVLWLARELGIEDQVRLTGYCPNPKVSEYLQSADIGVQLYPDGVCEKRSGLLTVMAHGLPVVSTCKGRVPSMFSHGENLWLVPVGNGKRLVEALEMLIKDGSLRNRLSENAVKTAAGFNWRIIGQTTDELYRSLQAQSP